MFYDIGLIFILVPKWLNIEQNNLAIWSHWTYFANRFYTNTQSDDSLSL